MEQAQPRDSHRGQVFGDLGDLVAQAGAHAVQVRHVGADLGGAVAHQGDFFLLQNARLDQLGDAAVAEIARQRNGLAVGQDLGGGRQGVFGAAAVVLAYQVEGVTPGATGLVGIAEGQLQAGRVGPALDRFKPGQRSHLGDDELGGPGNLHGQSGGHGRRAVNERQVLLHVVSSDLASFCRPVDFRRYAPEAALWRTLTFC